MEDLEKLEILNNFKKEILKQEEIPFDISEMINDNFWELI